MYSDITVLGRNASRTSAQLLVRDFTDFTVQFSLLPSTRFGFPCPSFCILLRLVGLVFLLSSIREGISAATHFWVLCHFSRGTISFAVSMIASLTCSHRPAVVGRRFSVWHWTWLSSCNSLIRCWVFSFISSVSCWYCRQQWSDHFHSFIEERSRLLKRIPQFSLDCYVVNKVANSVSGLLQVNCRRGRYSNQVVVVVWFSAMLHSISLSRLGGGGSLCGNFSVVVSFFVTYFI